MGTRGYIIITFNGKCLTIYNHFDSYPEGLGATLVKELQQLFTSFTMEEIRLMLQRIKVVNETQSPTAIDINALLEYTDLNVSTRSTQDWYCLLRKTQGSLMAIMRSGYALDCTRDAMGEYCYLLDFDQGTFAATENHENCTPRITFPIHNIPKDWIQQAFTKTTSEQNTTS